MTNIPTDPIEGDPIDVYRGMDLGEVRALLDHVLGGVQLGAYDTRIVDWLKSWDQPTIVTVASLILRSRRAEVANAGPAVGVE